MENNFNSIDIETFGSDPIKPYCFVVIYNKIKNVSYGLDCVEKALSWLFDTCPSGSTFFAHNLNFDGGLMLNFLPNDVDIREVGTLLKRGDIYSLCLVKKNKILFFKCSSKIFPLSLEEIGPLFNIPNKLFFDHNSVNELNIQDPVFKSNVIKYCVRDALIVTNFLTKIKFSVISYSNFNYVYSISGLALNIFKKNFNYFDIPIQLDEDVDNLIRPSYYGGRCEVFGNLKKTESCYHFDFSGMYTNRLKELYPLGDFKIIKKIDKIECNGFYYVKVRSNLKLPILPYRHPVSKKLLFPNGVFSGLYWCEELLLFIENGGDILEIFYCIKFEKFEYVFKSFGLECENKRQSTRYDKVLWKLIPNSFIGRLGIKYDNEETIIILDTDYDPRDYNVISDRKINNNWIVRVHNKLELRKKVNVGNVIYPSIITSKARILWWKSAKEVESNYGRILYCDTDSIFAAFDKKNNVLGCKHGAVYWDPNKNDTAIDDACFVTSKVYSVVYGGNSVTKIKGISKKYIRDYDFKKFKNFFKNKNKKSFKTILFEKSNLNIKIVELNKVIDFNSYDKRVFNHDKTETSSIVID